MKGIYRRFWMGWLIEFFFEGGLMKGVGGRREGWLGLAFGKVEVGKVPTYLPRGSGVLLVGGGGGGGGETSKDVKARWKWKLC